MKLYDAFPTKAVAQKTANGMRKLGVQYVQVRKGDYGDSGRLKYGVYLGGKNSSMYI
jgi:hypothetical protein